MNGAKEIKIETINYHIFNNIKSIRQINYEILMIILTFGLIVVGVLNVNHRLKPSDPAVS